MRRWPLTTRGTWAVVVAVVFFVAAVELGVTELVYFGVLLLALVAAALVSLHLSRATETVSRTIDPPVPSVGDVARVTVAVGIRKVPTAVSGTWRDGLPRTIRGEAHGEFPVPDAEARRARRVELGYDIRPSRRGPARLGPLTVVATDPFALARRARTVGERTTVLVAPAVVELASLPAAVGDSGGRADATDRLGQGADNLVARPWATGDSMRRIHWRATAHRGELMVRQEEQESAPEAVVVLDRSASRWSEAAVQGPGLDAGFERAVSACASVIARLVADGYAVTVIDTDGQQLVEPLGGGDAFGVEVATAALATVVARHGDHLSRLGRWLSGGVTGPLVVITGRLDEADAAALAAVASSSSLPVLLAVQAADGVLARVAETGWRTAGIGPGVDLTLAWHQGAAPEVARV